MLPRPPRPARDERASLTSSLAAAGQAGRGRWSLGPGEMYVLSPDGTGGDTLRHIAGPAHPGLVTSPSSPSAWRPAPRALTRTSVLRPGGCRPRCPAASKTGRAQGMQFAYHPDLQATPGDAAAQSDIGQIGGSRATSDRHAAQLAFQSGGILIDRSACRIAGSRTGGRPYRLVMHGSPPDGPRPIAARAGGHRRTGAGRRLFDHASGGEAPTGGRSRSRGPPARRRSDERRGGGGAQFVGTAAVGAAEKRGPQFPAMCRVCSRPGRPDYAVLVSGTEPADG